MALSATIVVNKTTPTGLTRPKESKMYTVLANLLSGSRIGLGVGIYLCILTQRIWWAVLLYGLAIFSDYFDGVMARKQQSFGKYGLYIDSGADFSLVLICYIALYQMHVIPWVFIGLTIGMYGQFVISNELGHKSNDKWGKYYGTAHMILQLILIVSQNSLMNQILLVGMGIYSGWCLVNRYKKVKGLTDTRILDQFE